MTQGNGFRRDNASPRGRLSEEEIVALIQHEAANTLQRILKNTSRLRRTAALFGSLDENDDWALSLREIEVEVKDLGRLMNLLPQLSAGQPIDLEPVLLQRIVPAVVLERWRGGDLRVAVRDLPDDLPSVQANAEMLRLVLHNLLANAEKYAPEAPIDITASNAGNSLLLRVRDYGSALCPSQLESIFQFFFRAEPHKTQAPGMGVGLALCRLLMTAMRGRITAEAPEGPGLQISLELPVISPEYA